MKLTYLKAAVAALVLTISGFSNATLIDNGYMAPVSGGWCSNCGDLDSRNFMVFDSLLLDVDSTLNSISFDISNYANNSNVLAESTDFIIEIWSADFTELARLWNFKTIDLTSYTSLGSRTFTVDYKLGDFMLAGGRYQIGISMDNGAFSTSAASYTRGADGDSSALQYNVRTGSYALQSNVAGDLPFRLTVNVVDANSIPEPTTMAMFALGVLGLFSRRFKKQ
jgi:hypothetical protein